MERLPRGRHGLSPEFVAQNQRQRLIAGLTEALYQVGYQKTTVSLIGERASVSKSDFYKHFQSKDECFFAAYEEAIEQIRKEVVDACARNEGSEWALRARGGVAARRPAPLRPLPGRGPARGPRGLRPLPGGGRELRPASAPGSARRAGRRPRAGGNRRGRGRRHRAAAGSTRARRRGGADRRAASRRARVRAHALPGRRGGEANNLCWMSEPTPGVFPSQELNQAMGAGWVSSGDYRIRPEAIQPASIDLRLGDFAWALRCSFLPDVNSTVEEKTEGLAFQKVDLRDGAVLERDRPYLVPLIEELALPEDVRAKANPKSSTGRLDVFTRVITDRHHRFAHIRAGYRGRLSLEIVPRSFAIQVKTGLSLNQLRLARGDVRLGDAEIVALQDDSPLLYMDSEAVPKSDLAVSDGLFLSLDLSGPGDRTVGYRAKKNSLPVNLAKIRAYRWHDYWDPVFPPAGGRGAVQTG